MKGGTLEHKYFVSFAAKIGRDTAVGNSVIRIDRPIESVDDIRAIERQLEEDDESDTGVPHIPLTDVNLTNFVLLGRSDPDRAADSSEAADATAEPEPELPVRGRVLKRTDEHPDLSGHSISYGSAFEPIQSYGPSTRRIPEED